MDPENKSAPGGQDKSAAGGRNEPDRGGQPPQARRIPNSDMQAEDAGTSSSGNEDDDARAAATEPATRQTSKTDAESGGRR